MAWNSEGGQVDLYYDGGRKFHQHSSEFPLFLQWPDFRPNIENNALTLTPPLSTADLIDDKKYATYSVSDVKLAAKTLTLYIGGDMAEKNTFHGFIKDLVCDQTLQHLMIQ